MYIKISVISKQLCVNFWNFQLESIKVFLTLRISFGTFITLYNTVITRQRISNLTIKNRNLSSMHLLIEVYSSRHTQNSLFQVLRSSAHMKKYPI